MQEYTPLLGCIFSCSIGRFVVSTQLRNGLVRDRRFTGLTLSALERETHPTVFQPYLVAERVCVAV